MTSRTLVKPVDLKAFQTMVQAVEDFWFSIVKVPVAWENAIEL